MRDDEQAIRDLITKWQEASATGDTAKLRNLMAEEVVFLVAGHPCADEMRLCRIRGGTATISN